MAAGTNSGDGGRPGPKERIEHKVISVRVELDEPGWEFDRKRCRVADARRALGRDLPHVKRVLHEVLSGHRRLRRQALSGALWRGHSSRGLHGERSEEHT